jgi:hypothetical protein
MLRGSRSLAVGLIWMTHTSSGSTASRSRTGGFCENSPSQYVPPPVRTARNNDGIAADASTASAVIRSRWLEKARKRPESTSTAPSTSSGNSRSRSATTSSKSTCRASSARNWSSPPSARGIMYGLIPGNRSRFCSTPAETSQALPSRSNRPLAALSIQNRSSSAPAPARSPSRSACQASSAQIAPPDVPDSPTTW